MAIRISNYGLSSIVGLALIAISLLIISSLIYNALNIIQELNHVNIENINRRVIRARVPYLVEGTYIPSDNSTIIVKIINNLPEPLQIIGYIIVNQDMSVEVFKVSNECLIVPPFNTTLITLRGGANPLGVIAAILIRDEVTHIVLRKSHLGDSSPST